MKMAPIGSTNRSSIISKIFFLCLLLTVLLAFLYNAVPQSNVISFILQTSPNTSTNHISRSSCNLSFSESDGWFCEFDDDWTRRKQLHYRQDKLNRHSNSAALFFQNNWEPTIQCEFEQRIGNVGDGGKWVCDTHRLQREKYIPLVYSFGSNGDFSFEREMKKVLPEAEIHTFDRGLFSCPVNVCTYHQATIGDGTSGTKSLTGVINELGHRQREIDILKIDIEGSEYSAFGAFFKNNQTTNNDTGSQHSATDVPYIRQILIEVHVLRRAGDDSFIRVHELFELFRQNNYAIFHKEANLYDARKAFEYALIRLNRAFFVPPS